MFIYVYTHTYMYVCIGRCRQFGEDTCLARIGSVAGTCDFEIRD